MATTALIITWLAVALKAPSAWRRPTVPARLMLWVALLALALGWSLRLPASFQAFNRLTGVPNLAQPVGDVLALTTGWAIVGMLLFQSQAEARTAVAKLRRRAVVLAATVVVMVAAFAIGHPDVETTDYVGTYASHDFLLVYYSAFLAFLGYVFADLFWLCRRYAAATDRRPLRVGLRLIAAAGALGLVYVLARAGFLAGVRAGHGEQLGTYARASSALVATVTLLAVTGASLPALAVRWSTYRSYRQLGPLWAALHSASPGIALGHERSPVRALFSLRELRLRLHSRIIEIRDGRRALRRYFRRAVAARAQRLARQQGLTPMEEVVTVEATTLAAAIDDKLSDRPPAPASERILEPVAPGGEDLEGELTFLRRVTRAFTRSRIVKLTAEHGRSR